MNNTNLYNASVGLLKLSKIVRKIDEDFANRMINKAQNYVDQILIDDKEIKEVEEYERKIKGKIFD